MSAFGRWCAGAALTAACVASAASAGAAGPRVALETTLGRIVVELDPERAPVSAANFLRYVAEGHYDDTLFHRVVENFVVQGGGLKPDMSEKPTRPAIVNEAANGLSNVAGSLAMAREEAVDSATSQFYINVADNLRLDHVVVPPEGVTVTRRGAELFVPQAEAVRVYGYAVFGRVVEGMDVVERMRHVPVTTFTRGDDVFENVPARPVVLTRAILLSPH